MNKANPRAFSHERGDEDRVFTEKNFVSKSDEHKGKMKAKKLYFKIRSDLQSADQEINKKNLSVNHTFQNKMENQSIQWRIDLSKIKNFESNQKFRGDFSPQPFWRKNYGYWA